MSEQILKISVPVSGVNLILGALGKLPYEQVKVLLESIHAEAVAQVEEANKPKADPATPAADTDKAVA